jgi:cell wall assembly regulator SMI1
VDENIFTNCEKEISEKEIRLVEQDLGIKLPDDFKDHYRRYNGGQPQNTILLDPIYEYHEVGYFMPLLYCKDSEDNPNSTLNGRAKVEWNEKSLPPSLLPFAFDWGGNYFCIDHKNGHIFYFLKDVWSENISIEKNWEINTVYVAASLKLFIENLIYDDENE